MLRIAIDGACRRNGRPDCVSGSGVFYKYADGACGVSSSYENCSTNQRGEQRALILALVLAQTSHEPNVHIVTDSEYLFNALTKNWCDRWAHNGWKTATGDDVKNSDLWMQIKRHVDTLDEMGIELSVYHIKGHLISFGRVTADKLLDANPAGRTLLNEMYKKFNASALTKAVSFEFAQQLSERNNGFRLQDNIFREFAVMNAMADIVATRAADAADISRE